jgi:hypothetical protein
MPTDDQFTLSKEGMDVFRTLAEDARSGRSKQQPNIPVGHRSRIEIYHGITTSIITAFITAGTGTGSGTGIHGTGDFGSGTVEVRGSQDLASGAVSPFDQQYSVTAYNIRTTEIPNGTPVVMGVDGDGKYIIIATGADSIAPPCNGFTGQETIYRTDCVGGVNIRYARTRTFVCGELLTPGSWAFDSTQGCCECVSPPHTGTGTGTGVIPGACGACGPSQASQWYCLAWPGITNGSACNPADVYTCNPTMRSGVPVVFTGNCAWTNAFTNVCGIVSSWTLFYDTVLKQWTVWVTRVTNGDIATYRASVADSAAWNCKTVLNLSKVTPVGSIDSFNTCANWPATMTATRNHGGNCGAGTGTGGGIQRFALGTACGSATSPNSYTAKLAGVTVNAGTKLVVSVGTAGANGGNVGGPASVTFAGMAMSKDIQSGPSSGGTTKVKGSVWSLTVASTTTGDIVATGTPGPLGSSGCCLAAAFVSNLASNAFDQSANAIGASSAPDTGATSSTTASPEYYQGSFEYYNGTVPSGAGGGFTLGQAASVTFAGIAFQLQEVFKIDTAAAPQNPDASLTGTTPAGWAGALATYK